MTADTPFADTDDASSPVRRRRGDPVVSLRDTAYEAIKRRIITCDLKPGEVLSEGVLSAELNIGRTPVHQAIDRLAADGLIDVLPRKGIMVKPISLHEIFDIIDVRLVNEAFCVRKVAELAEPTDIARLTENLDATWQAANGREIETMMNLAAPSTRACRKLAELPAARHHGQPARPLDPAPVHLAALQRTPRPRLRTARRRRRGYSQA